MTTTNTRVSKTKILISIGAGVLIGFLVVMLFPAYVGYMFNTENDNFYFVDFFHSNPYTTIVADKTGIIVPLQYKGMEGIIRQIITDMNTQQVNVVSSAIASEEGENYGIPQIAQYASKNFHYNLSKRRQIQPLDDTLAPTQFLTIKTGVCGDYGFFYVDALLARYGTATLIVINPEDVNKMGHVIAAYNGTVIGYTSYTTFSKAMKIWEQVYPTGVVFQLTATRKDKTGNGVLINITMWTFINDFTVTYPRRITKAIITYYVQSAPLKTITKSVKITPPVLGYITIIQDGTITVKSSKYTYFLANDVFGIEQNSTTAIIKYYGNGTTEYYYNVHTLN